MPEIAAEPVVSTRAPWHLWLVGILSLIWNVSGAYTIMSAQSGAPMDMDATEIAYYADQSPWLAALTDVALLAAILAAIALLLRSSWAVNLYGLSVVAIALSSVADIAGGTALLLESQEWLLVSCLTAGLAIAQLAYAMVMRKRGVLR